MLLGGPGNDVDGVRERIGQASCFRVRHFKHAGVPARTL